jgi:hypothetical protein
MARGKRLSVASVLDCSIARAALAVESSTTVHRLGPPWPVRANSKSPGGAPTVIVATGIMIASVSASAGSPAQASVHAARTIGRMKGEDRGCVLPSKRNLLDASSVAQNLDGGPSGGESAWSPWINEDTPAIWLGQYPDRNNPTASPPGRAASPSRPTSAART